MIDILQSIQETISTSTQSFNRIDEKEKQTQKLREGCDIQNQPLSLTNFNGREQRRIDTAGSYNRGATRGDTSTGSHQELEMPAGELDFE